MLGLEKILLYFLSRLETLPGDISQYQKAGRVLLWGGKQGESRYLENPIRELTYNKLIFLHSGESHLEDEEGGPRGEVTA